MIPPHLQGEQTQETKNLLKLYEPVRLRGTLLKVIKNVDEQTMNDFGDCFITYDHALRKFYLLLRNEDSVFAVVQDLMYMLPEKEEPGDVNLMNFTELV